MSDNLDFVNSSPQENLRDGLIVGSRLLKATTEPF